MTTLQKLLLLITIIYMTVLISAVTLVHKLIIIDGFVTSAAVLVFPISFVLSDIIAEIYGYEVARLIVWLGLLGQLIFAIFSYVIIQIPSPNNWHQQDAFSLILGSLPHIYLAGIIATLISSFANIYIISKWKILMNGKHFWLRSIGSSGIGEAIYTVICGLIIFLGQIPISELFTIILSIYVIKLIYAILLAGPANFLTTWMKGMSDKDILDIGINYNPFKLV